MKNTRVLHNSPPFYARHSLLLSTTIRRSRGYYLYCADERRIFDMYLGNGRLFYGHKPFQIARKSKEAIDQGLLSDLPHRYHQQLLQLCKKLFTQYRYFYLAPSLALFINALHRRLIFRVRSMRITDPAYWCCDKAGVAEHGSLRGRFLAYYRIGLPIPPATILLPLLPIPHANAAQLICSKIPLSLLWSTQYASAFDTVAMIEALRLLDASHIKRMYSNKRTDIIDPTTYRKYQLPSCWRSARYYLHTRLSRIKYNKLYQDLLESNILINPDCRGITMLPPQMPKKEYWKFVQISDKI